MYLIMDNFIIIVLFVKLLVIKINCFYLEEEWIVVKELFVSNVILVVLNLLIVLIVIIGNMLIFLVVLRMLVF